MVWIGFGKRIGWRLPNMTFLGWGYGWGSYIMGTDMHKILVQP